MSDPTQHTIEQAKAGDQAAVRALYQQHERHWFRLCLRYGRNREEAQDMMQEGLIRLFRDLKQFDPQRGSFPAWSNRVMVNAALRYLKQHQWEQVFEDLPSAASAESVDGYVEGEISAKELTRIIQQLPTGYRVVFNLYEIEGYSHREIAETLGISVGTSKSQLAKSKRVLRQRLELLF
ncbi:MAG: sigma-70 family RNA polymerase sigma factor [Bacteroidota bacterium]